MKTFFKAYAYALGYWISLAKEARARNIDPISDLDALDHLVKCLAYHILNNSAINSEDILFHDFRGKNPDGSDDDGGFFVVIGHGINKKLSTRLTDEQVEKLMKAMREVLKCPVADAPRWFRLQRVW